MDKLPRFSNNTAELNNSFGGVGMAAQFPGGVFAANGQILLENTTLDASTEGWLGTTPAPTEPALIKQSAAMVVVFTVAFSLISVLAFVNNTLVVTVIYKTPQLRTITNIFLANLAVADILVSVIVLPFTLLNNLFTEWLWGSLLCKTIPYVQGVVVSASVSTLVAVAVERFFAIYYPHKTIITNKVAGVIIVIIWIVPLIIQIPWALFFRTTDFARGVVTICHTESSSAEKGFFLGVVFLTCYLIPLAFISVFYSLIGYRVWQRKVSGIRGSQTERNIQRSKIRIVRMLITMALVFALLWLPLYSMRMMFYFGPQMGSQTKMISMRIIQPIAQWLSSANSCVNPFIYCYFSEAFRKNIFELLKSVPVFGKLSLGGRMQESIV